MEGLKLLQGLTKKEKGGKVAQDSSGGTAKKNLHWLATFQEKRPGRKTRELKVQEDSILHKSGRKRRRSKGKFTSC